MKGDTDKCDCGIGEMTAKHALEECQAEQRTIFWPIVGRSRNEN